MSYLDNCKQRIRNDLYKDLYNDETSVHIHFTEGGIISWGGAVKEAPPNATRRTWMVHRSMTQNCSLSEIF
jgi:NADPH-dependent 7-cyano-7-deazaguanine reductase QueF